MTGTIFASTSYDLGNDVSLAPLSAGDALVLATAFAEMAPWRPLGIPAERLRDFIGDASAHQARYAIRSGTKTAGFVCVDRDWLFGPYLHFLGVLPEYQNRGMGSAVVAWFLEEAEQSDARNAWVCVSDLNHGAHQVYARQGFSDVATLGDLLVVGHAEILMRKLLFVPGNA